MILGVDVSAWNSVNTPWAQLKGAGGEFALVKGDQATATSNHVAQARAAGLLVGEYFWHDPTVAASSQAAEFLDCCDRNQPDFVFLDMEHWWADWGKWRQWIAGKITQAQVPVVPKATIASHAKEVLGILSGALTCPVGMYSARWFIDGYAPGVASWAADYPFWVASYINEPVHQATWSEIGAGPPAGVEPVMPSGMVTWLLWQWSSHKIMPGTGDRIDLNVFDGSLECFRSWAGVREPEATIEGRLAKLEETVAILARDHGLTW